MDRVCPNLIIWSDCGVNSQVMDTISLQWESESLISCMCSIFINVRNSGLSIALQLSSLARDPAWHKQGLLTEVRQLKQQCSSCRSLSLCQNTMHYSCSRCLEIMLKQRFRVLCFLDTRHLAKVTFIKILRRTLCMYRHCSMDRIAVILSTPTKTEKVQN